MDKVKIFKALSDSNRLAIIALLENGEKCACVLLDKLDCCQSTLSHHMKVLCDAEIVNYRKDGKWMHYFLNNTTINELEDYFSSISKDITNNKDNNCTQCK